MTECHKENLNILTEEYNKQKLENFFNLALKLQRMDEVKKTSAADWQKQGKLL